METQIKVEQTRFPRLTRAILRRLDREQLEDVARHSADAGWNGFTMTADCVAFYKAHKADILEMAKQDSADFGQGVIEMIQCFRCLTAGNGGKPHYTQDEIAEALYSGRSEFADTIRNAMAWYALETVARELNPDI